ncbi:uncharacterized protein BP01DRAFT_362986 [Aspergillus saccharolyticus JOP 1030-1]|uniref:Uncharacterized protein n=1 Tax=Aspergillus saccharolyticus JOP 1030-1 TaxID=1450539 RepID=A0A318ZPD3_9EURO|nr:hypothetical protein BP01DRAFT_362986 [Aspergillus saccharolyticus JOP 1030-1]PYH48505.1 hypothetical protein BP01DRAFT_362986 [Aspergillus saccharolyticus JOP 1030-1]
MSSSSTPGVKPEKTMSSRLLTMKFMQRAAAEKATPQSSGETSTTPTKRQRLSTGSVQSPSTPQSDMDAVAAALAAEEEKRKEALARQAAESGDTEWVLDYGFDAPAPQPYVVADSSLDADDDMVYGGRQAYGNYKRKKKSAAGEQEDSDEDEDSEADPNDMEAMIKKEKKKALKEKNKPQPVKLSALTSISGGRHGGGGGGGDKKQKKRKHK